MNSVFMFEKGHLDLGYNIASRRLFKLRIKEASAIGAFNVTFNRSTICICKCATVCEGYFIRRVIWNKILTELDPTLLRSLK